MLVERDRILARQPDALQLAEREQGIEQVGIGLESRLVGGFRLGAQILRLEGLPRELLRPRGAGGLRSEALERGGRQLTADEPHARERVNVARLGAQRAIDLLVRLVELIALEVYAGEQQPPGCLARVRLHIRGAEVEGVSAVAARQRALGFLQPRVGLRRRRLCARGEAGEQQARRDAAQEHATTDGQ